MIPLPLIFPDTPAYDAAEADAIWQQCTGKGTFEANLVMPAKEMTFRCLRCGELTGWYGNQKRDSYHECDRCKYKTFHTFVRFGK